MISVVMATYNGGKYLGEQLSSIVAQISINDELIICDDGSSDNTLDIIEEFKQSYPYIKVFHGPGKGPAENFSFGLQKVKGEYIFLSDQDDIWYEDKIKIMVRSLKTHILCMCDSRLIDELGREIAPSYMDQHRSRIGFMQNIIRNSYVGCHMGFRKELLECALPIPIKIPMHDTWLAAIAEKRGRILWLKTPLMDYRRHDETFTGNKNSFLKKLTFRFRLIFEIMKRL